MNLTVFRRFLRAWYRRRRRSLPWRENPDPYRIWISEVMLQQTTVSAVVPYFERFLAAFPTLHDLAAADEEAVLRCWEGLGYYRRARHLRQAAQQVVRDWGGQIPKNPAELQSLPGVGRYTAGAIASIAFDERAPILEANTQRLHCRLTGLDDPRSAAAQRSLWSFAEALLPDRGRGAGEINQALMELGSQVCRPEAPHCGVCPVSQFCEAFRTGRQEEIPRTAARPKVTEWVEAAVALFRTAPHRRPLGERQVDAGREWLLFRRLESERWPGLWDFPRFAIADGGGLAPTPQQIAARLLEAFGLRARGLEPAASIRHSVTRYRFLLHGWRGEWAGGRSTTARETRWVGTSELSQTPMPAPGRRIAAQLLFDSKSARG